MKIRTEVQPVIYCRVNNHVEFLIIQRWDSTKEELHYRIIKGGVQKDETQEEAVSREVMEEVGLNKLEIEKQIDRYRFTSADGIIHNVHVYLVRSKRRANFKHGNLKANQEKIQQAIWLIAKDAIKILQFPQEKQCITKAIKFTRCM